MPLASPPPTYIDGVSKIVVVVVVGVVVVGVVVVVGFRQLSRHMYRITARFTRMLEIWDFLQD